MAKKNVRHHEIANPTIEDVLNEFYVYQSKRQGPATLQEYGYVIQLLVYYLDGYAYEGLSGKENSLFDKYFNATGKRHREFCQLFGPDKILQNLEMFFEYFLVSKIMADAKLLRASGATIEKLSRWLGEKGFISTSDADKGMKLGTSAALVLPKAEQAGEILGEISDNIKFDPDLLGEKNYIDFNLHTITKIKPGKLWLDVSFESDSQIIGPILVPKEVTDLLSVGWELSCSLARIKDQWLITELTNIYPRMLQNEPVLPETSKKQEKKSTDKKPQAEKIPKKMQPTFDSVTALIDHVCEEALDDEYRELCYRATAKLCRKRPSPLLHGKPASWACGIVYAMGQVNFLFDKSRQINLTTDKLCNLFGVSKATGGSKAKAVRDALKVKYQMDPDWCLPSLIDDNPLIWMLEVDGFVVDIRNMQRDVQVAAYEKGLIPYIPDDRKK